MNKEEAEIKKVNIKADKCKGCELCIEVCPVNILSMSEAINELGYHYAEVDDQDKCLSCGRCAVMCPDILIKVYDINE